MDEHLPLVMTVEVVAEHLPKVLRGSVYKLAQQGKIPGQKVGRHWGFHRQALKNGLAVRRDTDSGLDVRR